MPRNVALGVGLPVLFLGTGWAFLANVEGWLGVLLWIAISVPVCFVVEFLVRPRARAPRSPRSNPRMSVRAPARGSPERGQTARRTREADFAWSDGERPPQSRNRRRTHAR